jgi:hypothetical protein
MVNGFHKAGEVVDSPQAIVARNHTSGNFTLYDVSLSTGGGSTQGRIGSPKQPVNTRIRSTSWWLTNILCGSFVFQKAYFVGG